MKKDIMYGIFPDSAGRYGRLRTKNTANTTEQTDTQTEKTLEEHFFSAEQDEQNYNVMEEYSEDEEYPDLAAFLTEYYQIPEEECKETRYYYNYTDLNEDGTDEIVAVTIGIQHLIIAGMRHLF